jgi:hypothetical protein
MSLAPALQACHHDCGCMFMSDRPGWGCSSSSARCSNQRGRLLSRKTQFRPQARGRSSAKSLEIAHTYRPSWPPAPRHGQRGQHCLRPRPRPRLALARARAHTQALGARLDKVQVTHPRPISHVA